MVHQDEVAAQPKAVAPVAKQSNALHSKYVRWMKSVRMEGSPIEYIRGAIEEKLDKHKAKGIPTILMGDFNAHWDGSGATYHDLAD